MLIREVGNREGKGFVFNKGGEVGFYWLVSKGWKGRCTFCYRGGTKRRQIPLYSRVVAAKVTTSRGDMQCHIVICAGGRLCFIKNNSLTSPLRHSPRRVMNRPQRRSNGNWGTSPHEARSGGGGEGGWGREEKFSFS